MVTDDDGKPNVDTPEAAEGLDFLANGFKEGYIPKEAITYKEEEGRAAFQAGKLIFHRQWPYQYNLANGDEGTQGEGQVRRGAAARPRRSRRLQPRRPQLRRSRRTPRTRRPRWTSSSS